ncbi:MAG TPA: transporter [archaeon]|nr:transporter [archaeon]
MLSLDYLRDRFLLFKYLLPFASNRLRKVFVTVSLLCLFFTQTGRPEQISTDRPGLTNGTALVPKGALQIESGYSFSRVSDCKEHRLGELLLRLAPGTRLEFRLGVNSYLYTHSPGGDNSGFSDGSLGLKIKLFEGQGDPGIESIKISTVLSTTLPTGKKIYRENKLQPSAELILGWDLSGKIGISTSFSYALASAGGDQYNQFAGGAALGFSLSGRAGCFLEYYGVAVESGYGPGTSYLDGGLTYLLSDNCQADIHGGFGLDDQDPDYFIGFGLSYKFSFKK